MPHVWQEEPLVARRICMAFLWWAIWVAFVEGLFIGWFRLNGYGRSDYGEAFVAEPYIRAHMDLPCVYNGGQPCTQAQLAFAHHATTVNFWLDVRDRSVPLFVIALAILIACLIVVVGQYRRTSKEVAT